MILRRLLLGAGLLLVAVLLVALLHSGAVGRLRWDGARVGPYTFLPGGQQGGGPQPPPAGGDAAKDFSPLSTLVENSVASVPLQGASLLLIRDGRVVYQQAFGNYTLDTAVPIASGTKWLTAATIMALVDDGLLALDAPIARYLPGLDGDQARITMRQLLSGTSGLPNLSPCFDESSGTLAQCAGEIVHSPLVAAPGTAFCYSTAGFQVAGWLAEAVTGKPWATLFEEQLKLPLGMWSTTYGATANPVLGGGVTSTLRDYGRFLQMLLDGGVFQGQRVLSAAAVREMERDQTDDLPILLSMHQDGRRYGLGAWRDMVDAQGNAIQLSSQGDTGFSPWIDRQRHLCGVFLTEDELGNVYGLVAQVQQAVRDIVDSSAAGTPPPGAGS
ncbi:MAG TPA: serine hydrolase domain-containing protein [Anaerolineae bacterium]|nr:serine hydrolase domain-containing protein [Anaerolineae bacterium]HOQ97308.1 serine hydrolase domain-containing protein [Anaerolineae bacterium]HOQ97361.1 serine hydrolase domain-containing protein [Anaerolineae bacterium]HPL27546.1 serine hydrolase domain-containing protein [Anaerolineae bacterium]